MIAEYEIGGIFFSPVVPGVLLALGATILLRRLLARLGFYRLVWYPALFDVTVFLIFWAVITGLAAQR